MSDLAANNSIGVSENIITFNLPTSEWTETSNKYRRLLTSLVDVVSYLDFISNILPILYDLV